MYREGGSFCVWQDACSSVRLVVECWWLGVGKRKQKTCICSVKAKVEKRDFLCKICGWRMLYKSRID